MIADAAPWYISNKTFHNDLDIAYVMDEIRNISFCYMNRLNNHMNPLSASLLDETDET